MFTGLVVEMGEVVSITRKTNGARLSLKAPVLGPSAALGDSISINGTCLTVVDRRGQDLSFDLSDETLRSTNLGQLRERDRVNLEPALRLDAKLGGHFVTGHIDGVGVLRTKKKTGDVYAIEISAGQDITRYLVEKGSVAVDGISLTVVTVSQEGFSVVIIPHTAAMTTIGFKDAGDSVNIEVDILGKYVAKFMQKDRPSTLMKTLIEEGFA